MPYIDSHNPSLLHVYKKTLAGRVSSHARGKVRKVYNHFSFLGSRTNPQMPATTKCRKEDDSQSLGHPGSGRLCFPVQKSLSASKMGLGKFGKKKELKTRWWAAWPFRSLTKLNWVWALLPAPHHFLNEYAESDHWEHRPRRGKAQWCWVQLGVTHEGGRQVSPLPCNRVPANRSTQA